MPTGFGGFGPRTASRNSRSLLKGKIVVGQGKGSGKVWMSYEEVARDLLDRFRLEFGLERVESKQVVKG